MSFDALTSEALDGCWQLQEFQALELFDELDADRDGNLTAVELCSRLSDFGNLLTFLSTFCYTPPLHRVYLMKLSLVALYAAACLFARDGQLINLFKLKLECFW